MDDPFNESCGPYDAGPTASDEALQMHSVLKSLEASKLISDQCLQSGLQLVDVVPKDSELSGRLSRFIIDLEESLKTPNRKAESGGGSGSGWFSSKPKAKVFTGVSGETFSAHKYIMYKLKSKVDKVSTPQDCDVIVLFCPISSRVGSDVQAALKTIPESGRMKPVILVLMHHTRNIYYSADDSGWSDEYSSVVSHVDVLFHETRKGLLTCAKNDQAVHSLLDQCMQYAN